jgi:hypothetical protein
MSYPAQNTEVVAEGIARLTTFMRGQTVVPALLGAFLASVQDLENNAYAVFQSKNLNPETPPTGDLLDRIVAIAGLTRNGLTDVQLWTAFKLELLVLASRGRSEDILKIANVMTPSQLFEYPIASMLLECLDINTGIFDFPTLCTKLGQAKDGGARLTLVYSTWPTTENLSFSSVYGGATGTNYLATTYATISGTGLMAATTEIAGS